MSSYAKQPEVAASNLTVSDVHTSISGDGKRDNFTSGGHKFLIDKAADPLRLRCLWICFAKCSDSCCPHILQQPERVCFRPGEIKPVYDTLVYGRHEKMNIALPTSHT